MPTRTIKPRGKRASTTRQSQVVKQSVIIQLPARRQTTSKPRAVKGINLKALLARPFMPAQPTQQSFAIDFARQEQAVQKLLEQQAVLTNKLNSMTFTTQPGQPTMPTAAPDEVLRLSEARDEVAKEATARIAELQQNKAEQESDPTSIAKSTSFIDELRGRFGLGQLRPSQMRPASDSPEGSVSGEETGKSVGSSLPRERTASPSPEPEPEPLVIKKPRGRKPVEPPSMGTQLEKLDDKLRKQRYTKIEEMDAIGTETFKKLFKDAGVPMPDYVLTPGTQKLQKTTAAGAKENRLKALNYLRGQVAVKLKQKEPSGSVVRQPAAPPSPPPAPPVGEVIKVGVKPIVP